MLYSSVLANVSSTLWLSDSQKGFDNSSKEASECFANNVFAVCNATFVQREDGKDDKDDWRSPFFVSSFVKELHCYCLLFIFPFSHLDFKKNIKNIPRLPRVCHIGH